MPPEKTGQNPMSSAPSAAAAAGTSKKGLWLVVGIIVLLGAAVALYIQFPLDTWMGSAAPTEDMQMMADDGSVAADGSLMVNDSTVEGTASVTPPPPPPALPGTPSN